MPVGSAGAVTAAARNASGRGSKTRPRGVAEAPRPGPATGRARATGSTERRERPVRSHKVIFLGDQGVGKTSIIHQFLHGAFEEDRKATVGIDFVSKELCVDGVSKKLQLWDTAGQERFRALIPGYLRDTSACLIVYDVTGRDSFNSVRKWVEDVRRECGEDCSVLLLVGNKSDLLDARQVTTEEGEALAAELSMLFMESSARTGFQVAALLEAVARALPGATTPREEEVEDFEEISLGPPPDGSLNEVDAKRCAC